MDTFFAELKRRHVYRVGAAYAVVAWVLLQLFNNLTPVLKLPDWAGTLVLVLLIGGLPVALLFAWIQQLAPADGTLSRTATGRLDWFLAAALVVVIALVSYQQFAPSRVAGTAPQAGVDAARAASATQAGVISIAVLPFANMSGDTSQEFFSDGMTEEITSALAKVPDLRVVGRTSAFQFKGNNQDLRTIGQSLSATHLIEGSVRKAGDRVRITVQLIKADDGTHIWAEDYDRQLTDIFATQEDIARAIITALRMPLGLKPGENLVNNRNISPEDYQLFLHARELAKARGNANIQDSARMLEQVIARNPDYAPALAELGGKYFLLGNAAVASGPVEQVRRLGQEYLDKQEAVIRRALALDSNYVDSYGAGIVFWVRGKPLEGEAMFLKGLAIEPNNFGTMLPYSSRLAYVGRLKEALAMAQKAFALEPFDAALAPQVASDLWLTGDNEAAIAQAKALRPINRAPLLALFYASMGRYDEAADALMEIISADANSDMAREAARLLRMAPAAVQPKSLPDLAPPFNFVYLHVGAPERVLDYYERRIALNFINGASLAYIWHPSYAAVRKTERFKTIVRKAGYVEYWRAKGWPAFCHPTTADDFVCE